MASTQPELWVLGNLTIDDVVQCDGRLAMGMCGGNGIYTAIGARVWSDRVGLTARVGPDYPSVHLDSLRAAGIDLRLSPVSCPSIRNWALYEGADVRRFIPWLDSGTHLEQSISPDEVPSAARAAKVCHIAPMPLSVQSALVHDLSGTGPLVSLDPHDEYIGGRADDLLALLPLVSMFLPSRQEARLIYGRDDPEAAACAFAAAGPRVAVVKLGADGSLVCERDSLAVQHVPAFRAQVVDPTGAGDAFCGAFSVMYARTDDALDAARHASVAASFIVEHLGATSVLPLDRAQASDRLRQLSFGQQGALSPCAWTTSS